MTFDQLGLRPALLSRIDERGLTAPTPIQTRAIPEALKGRDIMGLAQTGTGKTLAFGLPIADALMATSEKADPRTARALILAPTRELAKQISDNLRDILQGAHLRIAWWSAGRRSMPRRSAWNAARISLSPRPAAFWTCWTADR